MTQELLFSTDKKIRLDEFLRQELPARINAQISNSKIRRLIVAGAVSVNNRQTARPSFELRGKSEITIELYLEKLFYEKQPDLRKNTAGRLPHPAGMGTDLRQPG